MSLQLHFLNLWLRLTVKSALNRMKHPRQMKEQLERDAARFFHVPEDAHFVPDTIRRSCDPGDRATIPLLWASRGRPDRRKVILYLHGGAYIAGSPQTHKGLAACLAGGAGARVVLPDYRLAPDDPFPAGLNDAVRTYEHLLDTGYDPAKIAIAGDSAGGGLAFAVLLALRDKGLALPACAVGFSPWTDMTGQADSLTRNARRDVMLPARRLAEVVGYYLGTTDRETPYASPLLGRWNDPPPSLLMASRSEILMDDATRMAEVLRAAGGNVQLELWHNLPHAWPIFVGRLPEADQAVHNASAFIARHLCAPEPEA